MELFERINMNEYLIIKVELKWELGVSYRKEGYEENVL